jgi:hypothetical protein
VNDYCDVHGSIYLEIKIMAGCATSIIPATLGHTFMTCHSFVIFLMRKQD